MNRLIVELTLFDIINLILRFEYLKNSSIVMLNDYSDVLSSEDFKIEFKNCFYSKPFIKHDKLNFRYENNDKCLILVFDDEKLKHLKIETNNKILLEII